MVTLTKCVFICRFISGVIAELMACLIACRKGVMAVPTKCRPIFACIVSGV